MQAGTTCESADREIRETDGRIGCDGVSGDASEADFICVK